MNIYECFEKQLSELNLLQSMFSSEEFHVHEKQMLDEMERFIEKKREALPRRVCFDLQIKVDDHKDAVTFTCTLPQNYPIENPEIYIKSELFDRKQQKLINENFTEYMESLHLEDTGLLSLIIWLQENVNEYILNSVKNEEKDSDHSVKKRRCNVLSRLWIYSHHIYRKELLKKIPECAKELDLTGFVLPGKPGIICVEGYKDNCDEYWQKLKYPNWKHISCKHREDLTLNDELIMSYNVELAKFKQFDSFEELAFEAHGDYGLRNDYHMDLGKFKQYLEEHNCKFMFNIFFGLDDDKK